MNEIGRRVRTESNLQQAAVLVPVYRKDGEIRLVIIRRTERGIHGGQLAFPGGRRDPDDASLEATALREANEEIGLVTSSTDVLARFPKVDTMVSSYRVTPFLAKVTPPERWVLQADEVAEVIEVRLDDLASPENHAIETWQLTGWPASRKIAFYRIGPYKLWGASYRILQPILPRLLEGEWAI